MWHSSCLGFLNTETIGIHHHAPAQELSTGPFNPPVGATFLTPKVLAPLGASGGHLSTHTLQSSPSFGFPPMIISSLHYDHFLAFALSSHEHTNGLYCLLSKPLKFLFYLIFFFFLDKV